MWSTRIPTSSSAPSSRGVNDILQTLRGEQFRHTQNVRRSQTRAAPTVSLSVHTRDSPTLPVGLDFSSCENAKGDDFYAVAAQVAPVRAAGPAPPKSWATSKGVIEQDGLSWRRRALSIMFQHLVPPCGTLEGPAIPPLTLLCLLQLLSSSTSSDFVTEVVPFLPRHLRRDLIRHTAMYGPLPSSMLYALCDPEGHADGELIVIGPEATLRRNVLYISHTQQANKRIQNEVISDWDSAAIQDDAACPPPLHTLILVSSVLPTSTFLALPPTLTHLALVRVTALPVHRLPSLCPLLAVLDLSYNDWLSAKASDRVAWTKWSHLEILGLKGVEWSEDLSKAINGELWVEIVIIR